MSNALAAVEFANNPEPRCPCVLLLDTSGSMQGAPLTALNEGLKYFRLELALDDLASRRVEVAVITFDSSVRIAHDFVTADQFEAPTLTAQGTTCMGSAIQQALDLLQARKNLYKINGVKYYRPWLFLITDGEPQGESESIVQQAIARIRDEENDRRVVFFAVGVQGANMARPATISVRDPVRLDGLKFREMFAWLSSSMGRIAQSQVGEQVALPAPTGWASI